MGCGSSTASAPGKFNDDPSMNDGGRVEFDAKTGTYVACGEGRDHDGPESDFFEVEEA